MINVSEQIFHTIIMHFVCVCAGHRHLNSQTEGLQTQTDGVLGPNRRQMDQNMMKF